VVDVDRVDLVLVQAAVLERVRLIAGLLEVGLDERAGVDDQGAVLDQVLEVGLEAGRVHRDQHVGRVARRVDLVGRKVELEARDTEQTTRGRADLGGEVGERRDVVAGFRRGLRKLGAGELHAITRIADEPDHDPVQMLGVHRYLSRSLSSGWRGPYQPFRRLSSAGAASGGQGPGQRNSREIAHTSVTRRARRTGR
jgi:hypothetical protein